MRAPPRALLSDTDPVELLGGLFGGYWMSQAAWIHIRERHYGRIVLSCALGSTVVDDVAEGNTVVGHGARRGDEHLEVRRSRPRHSGEYGGPRARPVTPDVLAVSWGIWPMSRVRTTGEIFTVRMDGLSRLFMGVNDGIFDAD